MRDLLPCPFCAETEMLRLETHPTREGTQEGWIECMNCGARGQTEYGRCPPDEMEALIRYGWNDRAARVRAEDNAGGPVAWGEDIDGKIVSVRLDKSRHCTVPLYPAPQPSGMVKALEWKKPKELRFRAACTHFGYEYFIDQTPNGWLLQTYLFGDEYWETLGSYPALDDAMYAAQADYERRILAALTAGKPEQSGWKLVPVEPTEEMCRALLNVDGWSVARAFKSYNWAGTFWKAMLAASPTPPTAGGGDE